jgi:GNAT superfamily N-acetyltransferase
MADASPHQQHEPHITVDRALVNVPAAIYQFPAKEPKIIPYLAALHANCVTLDGLISDFVPPLANQRLLDFWKTYISEYKEGSRYMILLLDESEPRPKLDGLRLLGIATLHMPSSESCPRRAVVQNVLISPRYRRRGGATALMAALEAEALRRGRTLLVRLPRRLARRCRSLRSSLKLADILFIGGRGPKQYRRRELLLQDGLPELWNRSALCNWPRRPIEGHVLLLQAFGRLAFRQSNLLVLFPGLMIVLLFIFCNLGENENLEREKGQLRRNKTLTNFKDSQRWPSTGGG